MRDKKAIETSINQIKVSGQKLDDKIQAVALEVLEHVEQNSEASLACKLYNALPKGARKNALVAWFLEFGKIKVNTGKDKEAIPLKFDKEGTTDLEGAKAKAWYDFKKEKAPSEEFDFDKALASLIKKAKKAMEAGHLNAANEEHLKTVLKLA